MKAYPIITFRQRKENYVQNFRERGYKGLFRLHILQNYKLPYDLFFHSLKTAFTYDTVHRICYTCEFLNIIGLFLQSSYNLNQYVLLKLI